MGALGKNKSFQMDTILKFGPPISVTAKTRAIKKLIFIVGNRLLVM